MFIYNGVQEQNQKNNYMRNLTKFYILFLITAVLSSCNSNDFENKVNTEQKIVYSQDSILNCYIESLVSINSTVNDRQVKYAELNYSLNDAFDTIKLKLAYKNNHPYKLVYPKFNIVGDFAGYESLYFNNEGLPFAIINNKNDFIFFNIGQSKFFDNIQFLNSFLTDNVKLSYDENRQCELVKQVDVLMHRFYKIVKYKITACENNLYDFTVISDSIILYKTPEIKSEIVNYLLNGTKIKYIEADEKIIMIGNETTFFIKIKIEGTKEFGWVIYLDKDMIARDEED